jgi:hypothetical protein
MFVFVRVFTLASFILERTETTDSLVPVILLCHNREYEPEPEHRRTGHMLARSIWLFVSYFFTTRQVSLDNLNSIHNVLYERVSRSIRQNA